MMAALFLAHGLPGCVYKVWEFLLREVGTLEVGFHLGLDPWVVLAFTSASPGKYVLGLGMTINCFPAA